MHLQELCKTDGEMSEDFISISKNQNYIVQCSTPFGWITLENPEYRNSVNYRVILKEEIK